MSDSLPLPKKPHWWALIRYKLAVSNWRLINHGLFLAGLGAFIFTALTLLGYRTPQWTVLSDTELESPLPRDQWPQIPDLAKPLILGNDGNPATLSLIDVKGRLIEIDANAKHAARGEPIVPLPEGSAASAAPRPAQVPALQAYDSWTSGSACSISGWDEAARPKVAALVRNGVWGCSGFKRSVAWWYLAIQLGIWPGFFLTLVLLGVMSVVAWFLGRSLLRHEQEYRLHRKLFGSWAG